MPKQNLISGCDVLDFFAETRQLAKYKAGENSVHTRYFALWMSGLVYAEKRRA